MKARPISTYFVLALVAGAAAAACGPAMQTSSPPESRTTTTVAVSKIEEPVATPPTRERFDTTLDAVGLDGSALDKSVSPCDDFYHFACGKWVERTEIPADKSRWARSFSVIDERNEADLKQILDQAVAEPKTPLAKKIGGFYAACMDEAAVEKQGTKPIASLLAKARRLREPADITKLLIDLHRQKIWALFDIESSQDFKDATRYVTYLDQNGLGLPDRDYYVGEDDKSKELRAQYLAHVERMLVLAGMPAKEAKDAAADVMHVETEIAKVSKTRTERRDPQGLYNMLTTQGLAQLAPKLDWDVYLKGMGVGQILDLNVTSKPFFEGASKLVESVPIAEWRHYFAWQVVHGTAKLLGKKFVDEDFAMEHALTGQKEIRVRWKRCIDATDEAVGELLAQPFVELRFSGEAKSAAEKLVHAIGDAFSAELPNLGWMDAKARAAAREKRAAISFLIGYPEKWRSYDFEIKKADYAGNALRGRSFDLVWQLAHIGKPVDRGEWEMTPPTVNAYYNAQKNQMVFPAGILQPPFYSVKASVPVNLGAMGMVVGHELTHGFDDEGSQFDKNGNMRDWWDPDVKKRFQDQTACVRDEYSEFETVPGVKLKGKLTLGENIADLGGVKLAFHAYRALTRDQKEAIADGYDEDQQFFISVGQVWCSKEREEWSRMAAQIDPHSPPRWRVDGSLRNLAEFQQAFKCKTPSPMDPAKKCSVW